jgi:hypothetical protein
MLTVPYDTPEGQREVFYFDPDNFQTYIEVPQTYNNSYDWYGYGPEENTHVLTLHIGNTTASAITPAITFTGGNRQPLNGTTQNVVAGQQIALTASYTLPSGITVSGQTWSVPGTTIGGYVASTASATITNPTFSNQFTVFYWMDSAQSRVVTFTLQLSDGTAATAEVTFNVTGPSSPSLTATILPGDAFISGNNLAFGDALNSFGIIFNPPIVVQPTGSSGVLSFVQVINYDREAYTFTGGTLSCTIGTGLDNFLPYPQTPNGGTNDSPLAGLGSDNLEVVHTFQAQMYLEWTPSNISNAIPVPLGSNIWSFSADAYRSDINSPFTVRNPTTKSPGSFSPGGTLPTWNNPVTNGAPVCH